MQDVLQAAELNYAVISDCTQVQNRIALSKNFYDKFISIWTSLGIKDRSLNVQSAALIKKAAWLLFIICKIKILGNREDITESAFLLYAVIRQVIVLLPSEVSCDLIECKFSMDNPFRVPKRV